MAYQPKIGDRVVVRAFEGRIEHAPEAPDTDSFYQVVVGDNGDDQPTLVWIQPSARITLEKVSEPEPQWVNGDLVGTTNPAVTIARINGIWLMVNSHVQVMDGEVSSRWRDGSLEVLYKADKKKDGGTKLAA